MTQLSGTILVRPNNFDLRGMTANAGKISLAWNGQMTPDGLCALTGDVKSTGLPVAWLDILPAGLAKGLDLKREGTTLALHLESLNREKTDAPWTFSGTLATTQVGLTVPVAISAARLNLVASGTYAPAHDALPAALDFTGAIAATETTVTDHLIETLTSKVQVDAADHAIRFTDIVGQVAGGTLEGTINVYTEGMAMPVAPMTMAAAPCLEHRLPRGWKRGRWPVRLVAMRPI